MIKRYFILSALLALLASNSFGEPTLEERLAALEKRVAELEAEKKQSSVEDKESSEKQNLLFHEGFEKGVVGWLEEIRYMQPENMWAVNKGHLQIHSWEKFRTAKELKTSEGPIEPIEGKRFLTAASQEKDVVIVNSSANVAHNVVLDWRAVHYFSTKEAISLSSLTLPAVSASINLRTPSKRERESRPGGMFIIGYYPEGGDLNSFETVGRVTENTEGWKEVEFEFSGAPKDKKIHLSFAYICADSRNSSAPGLQIDDIKVFDDGQ